MSTQAPALAGADACVVPEGTTAERTRSGRVRSVLGWLLVAAAAVLLWPAAWGGATGLTIVSGQSMEPTYRTGDLVVTWRSPGYEVGDVVSYTVPADQPGAGGHVIHRVSAVDDEAGRPVYTTRGDNNPADDQWALSDADVTGAAVLHVPGLGRLLGPTLLPVVTAAALGAIVTVLLWRSRDDDEPEAPDATDAPEDESA